MKNLDYQKLCAKTKANYKNKEKEILTYGLGIAGEGGDVAGCIKKTYCHDDDQIAGIRENIGDTMWYISMICNFYGWSLDEILEENIDKLKKRYPKGHFTFKHARRDNKRIDWNEK
jgi:NTP pyrophosphatase (non-canonical NTP hydrolase)